MVGSRIPMLILGLATIAIAQAPAEAPGCETTCRQAMAVDKAVSLGCAVNDAACLCKVPAFHDGIKDCVAKSCAPIIVDQVIADINNTFCAAAAAPPPPPPPPATTTPAPATEPTTSVSPTTPIVQTSTTPAAQTPTTGATSSTPTPAPAASTSSSTSAPPPASSTHTSTGTKSPTTTASPPVPTQSAAAEDTGLSAGAKIGIGIGAAIALVGLIGLLACIYLLRRRGGGRNALSMQISDPLPGSGRIFAKDLPAHRPFRTDLGGMTELELRSHPYEKMVPQQEPRTMV